MSGRKFTKLSPETVRHLFDYDATTGALTVRPGREKVARVYSHGRSVRAYNDDFPADSIAYYHATGQWHRTLWHHDRDPDNIRLANLTPLSGAYPLGKP